MLVGLVIRVLYGIWILFRYKVEATEREKEMKKVLEGEGVQVKEVKRGRGEEGEGVKEGA